MSSESLAARLTAAGQAAAAVAERRAGAALLPAVEAALEGREVEVAPGEDGSLQLRGPGLAARAFGSRRRPADPLLAGLLATLARGEPI